MDAFAWLCGFVALLLCYAEVRDRVRNWKDFRDRERTRTEQLRLWRMGSQSVNRGARVEGNEADVIDVKCESLGYSPEPKPLEALSEVRGVRPLGPVYPEYHKRDFRPFYYTSTDRDGRTVYVPVVGPEEKRRLRELCSGD